MYQRNNLNSETQPLVSKVATFSGDMWLNKNCPMAGGALWSRLEKQCDDIVAHLKEVTHARITPTRMEFFFKIDKVNK